MAFMACNDDETPAANPAGLQLHCPSLQLAEVSLYRDPAALNPEFNTYVDESGMSIGLVLLLLVLLFVVCCALVMVAGGCYVRERGKQQHLTLLNERLVDLGWDLENIPTKQEVEKMQVRVPASAAIPTQCRAEVIGRLPLPAAARLASRCCPRAR